MTAALCNKCVIKKLQNNRASITLTMEPFDPQKNCVRNLGIFGASKDWHSTAEFRIIAR